MPPRTVSIDDELRARGWARVAVPGRHGQVNWIWYPPSRVPQPAVMVGDGAHASQYGALALLCLLIVIAVIGAAIAVLR